MIRLLLLTLVVWLAAPSADAQSKRPNPLGPQWVQLFNGEDLTGWKEIGNESWTVVDGVIFGEGVSEEYGYLATEETYRDFHLSLRFKCDGDGNSGIYFHTAFKEGTATVTAGRQVEIDRVLGHHTGGVYSNAKGWIAWTAPEYGTVLRPNDWNDMLIQIEGNHYVVELNGIKVLDFTYPSPATEEGVIALQLHSGGEGRMRFKDIYLRDLTGR
jgi:hypothetical protein